MKALKKAPRKSVIPATRRPAALSKGTDHFYEIEKHLRKFCSVTSRELASVLGTIIGELDYATEHKDIDPKTHAHAMKVSLNAAERALTLARNLQYFAVLTRLDTQQVDLSQALLNTVDLLEKELEVKNIKLIVFAEASLHTHCDGRALQQVFFNLISNASHAMPNGGKLTLTLRQTAKMIEMTCADTGPTIPASAIERVFEPYFADGIRTRSETQGLTLAVAKALVEAHGGEIAVESREGENTVFRLHLPFDETQPKPQKFAEKRRHRRVAVSFPAELLVKGQPPLKTEITLLSVGGCFVRTPAPNDIRLPETNGIVGLRIYYYDEEVVLVPKARVANLIRSGNSAGIGVEFLDLDAKGKRVFAAIVKSHNS